MDFSKLTDDDKDKISVSLQSLKERNSSSIEEYEKEKVLINSQLDIFQKRLLVIEDAIKALDSNIGLIDLVLI